ncbi:MAG: LysR family transcriptional regulator [Rhodopseudomonas sp.]|nr:LysR family transcriptional regulator [Rhodopseudomonas sp.]
MRVGLSLQRIRSFVAVAEDRQFRRASERMGLSQPAMSAQLRELEEFLGAALLSRTTRSVYLTAEGEKFLVRARNILADIESAVLEVRDHASLRRGRLTVAAIPSVASRIIPGMVAAFTARFPGIDVQMIELAAQDVERCVTTGSADLGIAAAPDRNSELSFSYLMRDRFVGVVAKSNRLANQRRVKLSSLLEYPLITTVLGTSIRTALERACREQGRSLRVTHSVTQHQTVIAMVAAGLGVALLPSLSLGGNRDVVRLNVVDPQITRDLGVIQRKGEPSSAAAQEFIAAMGSALSV